MHDFMKTILSALKEWVNKRIKNNTPNWNENDPEADGYIKNRTHYKEIKTVIDLPETTFEFMDAGTGLYIAIVEKSILEWIPGVEKTISWDGIQYKCAISSIDDNNLLYLGNLSLTGTGTNTEEPFFIFSPESNVTVIYTNNTSSSHAISISGENIAIHKIPSEYLPEMSNVGANGSGKNAEIFNDYIHNEASGTYAHAEGSQAIALGKYSHAEGHSILAYGDCSHAEGEGTIAYGACSHAEGASDVSSVTVSGAANATVYNGSFQNSNIAPGWVISLDGTKTNLVMVDSVTDSTLTVYETLSNQAITNATFDCYPAASGGFSHTEGYLTAAGDFAHAEGYFSVASGSYSHAEGRSTASNLYSHAEGGSTASGKYTHAEGSSTASGDYSHAEGDDSVASGKYSHAEGYNTVASLAAAHAEGEYTKASGQYSHAEGSGSVASGHYSHAEGRSTIAAGES